jgi:hypothetical protein
MRPNLITRLKEEWNNLDPVDPLRGLIADAIDALAEQAQPVAVFDENLGRPKMLADAPMLKHGQTLYTAPPPRQPWVGLTLNEIQEMKDEGIFLANCEAITEVIEAKLKEKNT